MLVIFWSLYFHENLTIACVISERSQVPDSIFQASENSVNIQTEKKLWTVEFIWKYDTKLLFKKICGQKCLFPYKYGKFYWRIYLESKFCQTDFLFKNSIWRKYIRKKCKNSDRTSFSPSFFHGSSPKSYEKL